ncbi:hypothetical protein [Zobellella taiwanensis]
MPRPIAAALVVAVFLARSIVRPLRLDEAGRDELSELARLATQLQALVGRFRV